MQLLNPCAVNDIYHFYYIMADVKTERDILKEKYLEYYAVMPIKRYAAYSIGRDEDTTLRWEGEDEEFADRIKQLKAEYLRARAKDLKPEFIIPILFRDLTPRTELTGADGKSLFETINNLEKTDYDKLARELEQTSVGETGQQIVADDAPVQSQE